MTGNLPPGAATDPNAPWNQRYPEPTIYCSTCEWAGRRINLDEKSYCPDCGSPELEEI